MLVFIIFSMKEFNFLYVFKIINVYIPWRKLNIQQIVFFQKNTLVWNILNRVGLKITWTILVFVVEILSIFISSPKLFFCRNWVITILSKIQTVCTFDVSLLTWFYNCKSKLELPSAPRFWLKLELPSAPRLDLPRDVSKPGSGSKF